MKQRQRQQRQQAQAGAWRSIAGDRGGARRAIGAAVVMALALTSCAQRPASAPLTGTWNAASVAPDGVVQAHLDLGTTHGDWSTAKWAVYGLAGSTDLREWDGLEITIRTTEPRADVGLDVGLMEADGSWYNVHDAIPLTTPERTVRIPFSALRHGEWVFDAAGTSNGSDGNYDENFRCDLSAIGRIAVGVVNGRGVGTVSFSVVSLRAARWLERPAATTATVEISGRRLQVNDTDSVPPGIFGFHIVDLTGASRVRELRVGSLRTCEALRWGTGFAKAPDPANGVDFYVTGLYDRKQQFPQIEDPKNWHLGAEKCAEGIVASVRAGGFAEQAIIEFWNEPYLDLGKMLDGQFTLPLDNPTGVKAGDAVTVGERTFTSMQWVEGREIQVAGKPPRRLWPRQPAVPPWRTPEEKSGWDAGKPLLIGIDPTRTSYWSGRQIAELYSEALLAVATPVKAAEPQVRFVASYGFRPCEDRWHGWKVLDQYTIDQTINVIDGYGEHHYQGYPDGIAASYDVVMAYADTTHGKRLKSYNTEANDLWDSPARGGHVTTPQNTAEHVAARRLGYNLRDLLYVLRETPDKLVARAIHSLWSSGVPLHAGESATARELSLTLNTVTFSETPPPGCTTAYTAGTRFVTAEVALVNANTRMPRDFNPTVPVILNAPLAPLAPLATLVAAPGLISAKTSIKPTATMTARVMWALPADVTDHTVMTWRPEGFPRRWLLNGSLTADDLPPWEVVGINEGEYRCLQFLRNLRGPLLDITSSDPGVWCAASIDAANQQLSLVAYRASGPSDPSGPVHFSITAPTGTTFGTGQRDTLGVSAAGEISLTSAPEIAQGPTHHLTCELPEDGGVAVTLSLNGTWPANADMVRNQYYCTGILKDLAPATSVVLPVRLPATAASATKAWIQVVVEELGDHEGSVEIAGRRYELPAAYSPPNCPMIRRVSIDPALLAGVTQVTFHAAGPAVGNGFLLCAASVVCEQ